MTTRRVSIVSIIVGVTTLAACGPSIEPGQADPGSIGAACAAPTDCTQVTDPACLRMGTDGYCATDCSSLGQFDCPSGSVCEELGDQAVYCVDGCCSNGDCRDGFRCARRPELDTYLDLTACTSPGVCLLSCTSDAACEVGYKCQVSTGECVPKKSLEAGVGAACAKNEDCNSNTCLTGFPGGYCTSPCGTQFQACEPGSECYAQGDGASSCYKLCQTTDECRSGYRCQVVAESSETDKARGYCVPHCESTGCDDGFHCDAASGACVEGAAEPGPIGAFCASDDECDSGDCDTGLPNGYCTTDCGSCGGVCIGDACRAACDNPGDCRFGYLCDGGGCIAACRQDGDCGAFPGTVCNTGSGKCVTPSAGTSVETFAEETITVSDSGSEPVVFNVPENAISAVIFAEDNQQVLIALNQVIVPGNTTVFDISDPTNSRFGLLPTESNFSALLPPGPVFNFIAGQYSVSFLRDSGSASTNVRIFGKVSDGFPERQAIDVVYTFVSSPEGLNAAAAKNDASFQQAVGKFEGLYEALGIDVGNSIYQDLDSAALKTIDTIEGPNSELSQLFSNSTDQGQGLSFFFVQEIVGGEEGYIILGISGGIPGPPAIQGTPHSGVALSLLDFRSQADVLGQTMAHEGGHYLGLFHTTESNGTSHDPLPDTLECAASDDDNFDGYLSDEECSGKGSDNFMFWLASTSSDGVSEEQGRVLRRNPGTK